MALHGAVKVNGRTLYEWSAQRLTADINQTNQYRVHLYDNMGEVIAQGDVAHAYSDGAVELAAKVLIWASDVTQSSSRTEQPTSS